MLRKILLIAKRDFIASVFRKAFLIGLVLAPLLFGGSFFGIALLVRVAQGDKEQRIALIDHTGALANAIIQAASEQGRVDPVPKAAQSLIGPGYVFEVTPPD